MTCEHKNIHVMDFIRGWSTDAEGITQWVNRLCDKCLQHWSGPVGNVKEYTRAEWDALIAEEAEKERAYCKAYADSLNTSPECVQKTANS